MAQSLRALPALPKNHNSLPSTLLLLSRSGAPVTSAPGDDAFCWTPEDPTGSQYSHAPTHYNDQNSNSRGCDTLFWLPPALNMQEVQTYMQARHS